VSQQAGHGRKERHACPKSNAVSEKEKASALGYPPCQKNPKLNINAKEKGGKYTTHSNLKENSGKEEKDQAGPGGYWSDKGSPKEQLEKT